MRYLNLSPLLFLLVVLAVAQNANAQKNLVIIGSSTSACFAVDATTECYVGRLSSYYNAEPPYDTSIDNHLAQGGLNCYNGMPSSYISPYDAPYQPNTARNITMALTLNPDVILVNYPTNGYDVLRTDSILYCLRTIRDSANKKGVPCFITTTQPRTSTGFDNSIVKAKLAELKDSILAEFGDFAIDFYTGLINPADSSILYDSGDGIHMNAQGHEILFQRVLAKNIFLATLPATFLQFNTIYKNQVNLVSWTTAQETDVAYYEVQRSSNGLNFSTIGTLPAGNNSGSHQYQYKDALDLKGRIYYKILIVDKDGKKHASPVMTVFLNTGKLSILRAFARSSAQVVVEVQNNIAQQAELQLINNMGMVVSRMSRKVDAGNTLLYLSTPVLSNGIYHIKIAAGNESAVYSFVKN